MARNRSYPQLGLLLIGQALYLPVADAEDANRVRVAAHNFANRRGLTFETHYNRRDGELEIVRLPGPMPEDNAMVLGRIGEPIRRTAPTRS